MISPVWHLQPQIQFSMSLQVLDFHSSMYLNSTRMHSSRMCTVRISGGECTWSGGVYLVWGCTWSWGGVPGLGVYLVQCGEPGPGGYLVPGGCTWSRGCTGSGGVYLVWGVYLVPGRCTWSWGGTWFQGGCT